MIITRTPFRITLGGGGTDLESYYSQYGGWVFSAAIDKYTYILINRPVVDRMIRLKYSVSETVEHVSQLNHKLAKACLEHQGIFDQIEVCSVADIPSGTGLGSSSAYAVGLLNSLHTLQRDYHPVPELAEMAHQIEKTKFNPSVGKQDHYMAAFGGLRILDIQKDGKVNVRSAKIDSILLNELNRNTLIFYTGQTRSADEILQQQSKAVANQDSAATSSMHTIKEIGMKILEELERGNIDAFGTLMHDHWEAKKKIATKMTDPRLDRIYEIAREHGALGGKIIGAGGGGFFVFYTPKHHTDVRKAMRAEGLNELSYRFDLDGSKILGNFAQATNGFIETAARPAPML